MSDPEVAMPEPAAAAAAETAEMPTSDEALLSPESEAAQEPVERIAQTQEALSRLVELAASYAHPFRRDVQRVEYVFDPQGIDPENGQPGAVVEKNIPVQTGAPGLQTIDLRTYAGGDESAVYHLSLSFLPPSADQPAASTALMLSGEWPLGLAPNLSGNAHAAQASGRRIQDFMYSPGASSVPVREADFSYLAWYRPVGGERSYNATQPQMDIILKLLADAHVMNGHEKGPKLAELVPEVAALAPQVAVSAEAA